MEAFLKVVICNDVCRDLGKRKVPLSFCILALFFQLYVYNCEAFEKKKSSHTRVQYNILAKRNISEQSF